jgi:hypothetical protein
MRYTGQGKPSLQCFNVTVSQSISLISSRVAMLPCTSQIQQPLLHTAARHECSSVPVPSLSDTNLASPTTGPAGVPNVPSPDHNWAGGSVRRPCYNVPCTTCPDIASLQQSNALLHLNGSRCCSSGSVPMFHRLTTFKLAAVFGAHVTVFHVPAGQLPPFRCLHQHLDISEHRCSAGNVPMFHVTRGIPSRPNPAALIQVHSPLSARCCLGCWP